MIGSGTEVVSAPPFRARRWVESLPFRAVAVLLVTRLVCLAALGAAAQHVHRPFSAALTVFDGSFYKYIAVYGYPQVVPTGHGPEAQSPLAFFPLYPALLAVLEKVGLPVAAAAVLLDTVAAASAAVLIALIVRSWQGDRTALLTVALWGAYPLAVVLSLAYAEALFVMFAAGCLLALSRERTVVAGLCAALASLTRPTGVVLILLCLALAMRRRSLPMLGAAALGVTGFGGWLMVLALRTGHVDAWMLTERRGWDTYFDGGVQSAQRASHYLAHPFERPAATAVALVLIIMVALIVAATLGAMPRLYLLYSVLLFVLAVGAHNAYSSTPRFMLPAFPLLVPIASLLARFPRSLAITAMVIATAVMAGCGVYVALYSTYPP